jgi:hypothetical protein
MGIETRPNGTLLRFWELSSKALEFRSQKSVKSAEASCNVNKRAEIESVRDALFMVGGFPFDLSL